MGRIQNKNMSLKGTLIMALVLFCLRLVLCISCLVIHTFVTSDYNWSIPLWVWAIIFGIGVLLDIVLIYGATKKDVTAIRFWNVLQVLVGGLLFIMIFLLTKKAIQEIKEEKSMNENIQKVYTISYSPKGQKRNKTSSGSVNSLDSNVSSNL